MARHRVASGEVVSLQPLGAALATTRTHALLKAPQLEIVRLVLPAGGVLPDHAAPGEITLLGLEGRVTLVLPARSVELGAGDFIHLAAGEPHALRAHGPASLLLTLRLGAE